MIYGAGSTAWGAGGEVQKPIYLDNQATTPVDPRVAEVLVRVMTHVYGNSNSVEHSFGAHAAAVVEEAAVHVGALVDASANDVFFTSGATEALRLALAHASARRSRAAVKVALTRVEHGAVIGTVAALERSGSIKVTWIDVDSKARIDCRTLQRVLSGGVDIVCVMAANNEVGTIYPIRDIAQIVHHAGGIIIVDATQGAGHIPLSVAEWSLDYVAFSSHKIYGPKGVGALVAPGVDVRRELEESLTPLSGTLNTPAIAGFGEAARLRFIEMRDDSRRVRALRDLLEHNLTQALPDLVVNGDRECRLAHNLHIAVPGVPNGPVLSRLARRVAMSSGAACSSGSLETSHVLRAMGLSPDIQEGAIRISLGKFTTEREVGCAGAAIVRAIEAVRQSLNLKAHA